MIEVTITPGLGLMVVTSSALMVMWEVEGFDIVL
jgi:hypothetical protein